MTLNEYEVATKRTAEDDPNNKFVFALGLCGESGEVAELIKKSIGHGINYDREKMKKELGDVLWYVARLAAEHEISLEEVAQANIDKLKIRYPDGFIKGGGIR